LLYLLIYDFAENSQFEGSYLRISQLIMIMQKFMVIALSIPSKKVLKF